MVTARSQTLERRSAWRAPQRVEAPVVVTLASVISQTSRRPLSCPGSESRQVETIIPIDYRDFIPYSTVIRESRSRQRLESPGL